MTKKKKSLRLESPTKNLNNIRDSRLHFFSFCKNFQSNFVTGFYVKIIIKYIKLQVNGKGMRIIV